MQSPSPVQTAFVAFLIATPVLLYRGWDAGRWLMYLDTAFVQSALENRPRISSGGSPIGAGSLLEPFSGYLHFVARFGAEVLTTVSLEYLPVLIFSTSTLVWASCATVIAWSVSSASGRSAAGVVAGLALVLAPAANIILLGQLNALQWPMLAAAAVFAASGARPRTRAGWTIAVVALALLALNAALSFLVAGLFMIHAVRTRRIWPELGLFAAIAVPFSLQIYAYFGQSVRQVVYKAPSGVVREFGYAFHTVIPSRFRWSYGGDLSMTQFVVAASWWVIVVGAVIVGLRRADGPTRARSIVYFSTGLAFLVTSVGLNGNLNHHYLLVPTTCAIVGAIEIVGHLRQRHLTTVLVVAFLITSLPLLTSRLDDSFYTQPGVRSWRDGYEEAIRSCVASGDISQVPGSVFIRCP